MAAPRHPLPVATQMILGDGHGLRDPERWVRKQIKLGRFTAQKIGRQWFMRTEDIEAAEDALTNQASTAPAVNNVNAAIADPHTITGGLTDRGARRLITSPQL